MNTTAKRIQQTPAKPTVATPKPRMVRVVRLPRAERIGRSIAVPGGAYMLNPRALR